MSKINEFIKIPKSTIALAEEIKKAVDAYWNREISQIELKELLWAWASTGKLLKANDFNITVRRYAGKKRMEVVEKLMEGYQQKF